MSTDCLDALRAGQISFTAVPRAVALFATQWQTAYNATAASKGWQGKNREVLIMDHFNTLMTPLDNFAHFLGKGRNVSFTDVSVPFLQAPSMLLQDIIRGA